MRTDQLSVARLEVGLLETLDERLNLGRISFRSIIEHGHHRSPLARRTSCPFGTPAWFEIPGRQ